MKDFRCLTEYRERMYEGRTFIDNIDLALLLRGESKVIRKRYSLKKLHATLCKLINEDKEFRNSINFDELIDVVKFWKGEIEKKIKGYSPFMISEISEAIYNDNLLYLYIMYRYDLESSRIRSFCDVLVEADCAYNLNKLYSLEEKEELKNNLLLSLTIEANKFFDKKKKQV